MTNGVAKEEIPSEMQKAAQAMVDDWYAGSPAARFDWLMTELNKRLPDPDPTSAKPPEVRFIAMLDAALTPLKGPAEASKGVPFWPFELKNLIYETLKYYADRTTYRGQRIGGWLSSQRTDAPGIEELVSFAQIAIDKIEALRVAQTSESVQVKEPAEPYAWYSAAMDLCITDKNKRELIDKMPHVKTFSTPLYTSVQVKGADK